jgi:hypothetical protein
VDLRFGILDGEEIVVAVLVIDPQVGSDHLVRRQRRDDVVQHFFLRQPELCGMEPVHIDAKRGIIEVLGHEYIGDLWRAPQFMGNLLGNFVVRSKVGAGNLDIDRRGRSHVDNRIDQAAC